MAENQTEQHLRSRTASIIHALEPWLFVAAFIALLIIVGTIETGGLK